MRQIKCVVWKPRLSIREHVFRGEHDTNSGANIYLPTKISTSKFSNLVNIDLLVAQRLICNQRHYEIGELVNLVSVCILLLDLPRCWEVEWGF